MSTVGIDSDSATIPSINLTEQASNPASPASGHWQLFLKTDGLYIKNSAGVVHKIVLPTELGVWVDWTPTVYQDGAVAVTVVEAKGCIIGKVCHVYGKLLVTGEGTTNNPIVIGGQPAAMQPALIGIVIGTLEVYDGSQGFAYMGALEDGDVTEWVGQIHNSGSKIGVDPSFALAVDDTIIFTATYPVA